MKRYEICEEKRNEMEGRKKIACELIPKENQRNKTRDLSKKVSKIRERREIMSKVTVVVIGLLLIVTASITDGLRLSGPPRHKVNLSDNMTVLDWNNSLNVTVNYKEEPWFGATLDMRLDKLRKIAMENNLSINLSHFEKLKYPMKEPRYYE